MGAAAQLVEEVAAVVVVGDGVVELGVVVAMQGRMDKMDRMVPLEVAVVEEVVVGREVVKVEKEGEEVGLVEMGQTEKTGINDIYN